MIHFKHKFVFIHVPKTGGTSIEMALAGFHDDSRTDHLLKNIGELTTPEFHFPHRQRTGRHLPFSYYKAYIENQSGEKIDDYTIFTSVRNPWARALSAFNYWQRIRPSNLSHASLSFRIRRCYVPDFAAKLLGSRIGILVYFLGTPNENLRDPISYWLENNSVDFVLRCESLDEDFASMCKSRKPPVSAADLCGDGVVRGDVHCLYGYG